MAPPRKNVRKPLRVIASLDSAHGFGVWAMRYLDHLEVRHYSPRTLRNAETHLGAFARWCGSRGLTEPREVTKPVIDGYQRHLFHAKKDDGEPLSPRAQWNYLATIRSFFKWLTRQNVLLGNPASEIEMPRIPVRLPGVVLTHDESEVVMHVPDVNTSCGLRDRAILEVFYSTGIRRCEVARLALGDVDRERGTLYIREGKGKKDRVVPIGDRALDWVDRYIDGVRPSFVCGRNEETIFLTQDGKPLRLKALTAKVTKYVDAADLGKRGSCHLFRHTMATVMLEGGADIRYIQEILGHAHLSSTEVYTRVSIQRLKAIHTATHPAAASVTAKSVVKTTERHSPHPPEASRSGQHIA
jgi:integrase/recombinase XerD